MDFFEAVKRRVSVREYSSKPIDEASLHKIIEAALLAPTARCVQPWQFITVTDKKDLTWLGETAPNAPFLKAAAAAIIVFCENTKYYLEDGCAATENILLAATALGIASCWVAGDKKDYAPQVCKHFNAPEKYKLVSILSLGYAQSKPIPQMKKSLTEALHKGKF